MLFTSWNQKIPKGASNEIISTLALVFARRISANELREHLIACVTSNDFRSLCDYSLSYADISTADALNARQVLAFYTKRDDIDIGEDRLRNAVETFSRCEARCAETNDIFRKVRRGDFQMSTRVNTVLHGAIRKISHILGDVPSFESLSVRFGPGATTDVQKRTASARQKLSKGFSCSEALVPIVKYCLEELPQWVFGHTPREEVDPMTPGYEPLLEDFVPVDPNVRLVDVEIKPSRLNFVRKNAKTYRSIGVENGLDSMFQIAVGSDIAAKLRKVGIDIRDQTRNQRLAREGSISGRIATVDLRSASDCLAYELVHELFPIDWACFLSFFRNPEMDSKELGLMRLHMFSSMGNGITFPLQTLIFYALASSCCEDGDDLSHVSVYGDDITIPTHRAELLYEVLNAVGFIVNTEKSYTTGNFRESCGKDYLSGIDIRPCYVKDQLEVSDLFRMHNFFYRQYAYEEVCVYLRDLIHPSIRLFGPDGYGDGHLLGDDRPISPHNRKRGWAGYTFETFTYKAVKRFYALPGDYVFPSYSIYVKADGPSSESFTPHGVRGFQDTFPGSQGVKRIKIYTLSS